FGLDVWPVDPPNVIGIEDSLHGADRRQRFFQLLEKRGVKHTRLRRGLIAIVFVDVPAAEYKILQIRQRDEILDARAPAFGALAQTNGCQLRNRSDGLRQSALDGFYAGDERGCYRSHAGDQDSQVAFGRCYLDIFFAGQLALSFCFEWPGRIGHTAMMRCRAGFSATVYGIEML